MTNEIIETVKSCLTLLIAILCLIFQNLDLKKIKDMQLNMKIVVFY